MTLSPAAIQMSLMLVVMGLMVETWFSIRWMARRNKTRNYFGRYVTTATIFILAVMLFIDNLWLWLANSRG